MDSFRQGQISQSDCEISSNSGKKSFGIINTFALTINQFFIAPYFKKESFHLKIW